MSIESEINRGLNLDTVLKDFWRKEMFLLANAFFSIVVYNSIKQIIWPPNFELAAPL